MRVRRRSAAALAGCAAIAFAGAGCGGGGGDNIASSTLSDSGCSYDGDSTPTAGPLTVKVSNTASKDGSFAIAEIAAGSTVDDLEAYMAREQARITDGKSVEGPPAFYAENVRLSVPVGTESQLTGDLVAGSSYALVCLTEDKKGQPLKLYVATQLLPQL